MTAMSLLDSGQGQDPGSRFKVSCYKLQCEIASHDACKPADRLQAASAHRHLTFIR